MDERRAADESDPAGALPPAPRPGRGRRPGLPPASVSVGRILSKSLEILVRNLPAFALLSLLVYAPMLLLDVTSAKRALEEGGNDGPLNRLLGFVLPYVLAGALAYGVFQQLRGRTAPFLSCVGRGLARLLLVVGVAITIVVAMGLAMLVPILLFAEVDPILGLVRLLGALVVFVLLSLMWYVAVPAAVVEPRMTPPAALSRSADLTRGARGSLFLVLLAQLLLGGAAEVLIHLAGVETARTVAGMRTWLVLGTLTSAFFAAWQATAATVAYHDLRVAKEGIDTDAIASIFE